MTTKICNQCKVEKELCEFGKKKDTKDGYRGICKECKSIENKKWNISNPEKVKITRRKSDKKWRENNTQKVQAIRERPNMKIANRLRKRMASALNSKNKSASTMELLGCDIDFFLNYLAQKFEPGMTWENYGFYGWHIDHIIPCAAFDLTKEEEQRKCFHYSNLQPLWWQDNLSKGDKIIS